MNRQRFHLRLHHLLLAGLTLCSCRDEGITTQEVPKGSEKIMAAVEHPAPPHSASVADELRIWSVPAGWSEVPTTSAMRLATLMAKVPGSDPVEVAVTSFPGDVGGDIANVNRWRGQMGLEPLAKEDLEDSLDRFSSPGYAGYFLRIDSKKGAMLAAGVKDVGGTRSWFVRVTTDGDTASAVQESVRAFAAGFGGVSGVAK